VYRDIPEELRNLIERHFVLSGRRGADLASLDLPTHPDSNESGLVIEIPEAGVSLAAVERDLVRAALRRSGFVQKDAAALLGISSRKLNYMIRQMGVTHPSWRRNRRAPNQGAAAAEAPAVAIAGLNSCKDSDS
jgi:DNA-binding NtrC family response regulator